jgi:hypothetical protein
VKTLLAGGVPDLITEYAVFEAAFLCEESSADCRLFVGLEFVVDLSNLVDGKKDPWYNEKVHTKRRTTEDLPTAASPG